MMASVKNNVITCLGGILTVLTCLKYLPALEGPEHCFMKPTRIGTLMSRPICCLDPYG